MVFVYAFIFLLKQVSIMFSYLLNKEKYEDEEITKLLRTKIFTLQCIDYINLCYITEALANKNLIQITLYPYLMIYSCVMDMTTLYVDYISNNEEAPIYPALSVHTFFLIIEMFWTLKHIKKNEEEYGLKYLRRYGASTEFNRAFSIREDLMLCLRFNVFSQYITAVHYFLDVYVDNKTIVCLMFIGQIHLGLVNISYSVFKKKEIKSVRIIQIINLFLAVFIRFSQLSIAIRTTTRLERLNFYSIFGVEIITLFMMIYISYLDYQNFGTGLEMK